MITENAYKKLDNQQKIGYLQKTLDVQVAYANELEIQMADVEAENLNFRLQLGRSAKHTDKVDAENKRLRENCPLVDITHGHYLACNHCGKETAVTKTDEFLHKTDDDCWYKDALSKESERTQKIGIETTQILVLKWYNASLWILCLRTYYLRYFKPLSTNRVELTRAARQSQKD